MIIGIHGKARSGKDEVANILCDMFGFKKLLFAGRLKEFAVELFGLDYEYAYVKRDKAARQILQGIGNSVRNNITYLKNQFEGGTHSFGLSKYPLWVEKIAVDEFAVEVTALKGKKKYTKQVLQGIFDLFNKYLNEFVTITNGSHDNDIWVNYLIRMIDQGKLHVIPDVRHANEKEAIRKLGGRVIKVNRIDKPKIEAGADHISEVALDLDTDWDFIVTNEHKTEWKERLVLATTNSVRKFDSEHLFEEQHRKNFKINLD